MQVINLRQSGNQDILGFGPKTISKAGCMLTSLCMAVNALNGTKYTPSTLNLVLRQVGAFAGSGLIMDAACKRLGLKGARKHATSFEVIDAVAKGQVVMLGVDYKPGHSSGFSDADHFVLAHKPGISASNVAVAVVAADPATGTDVIFYNETRVENKKDVKRLVCRPALGKLEWVVCEAFFFTVV